MAQSMKYLLGTGFMDRDHAFAVLDAFYETGGRDLDTARIYPDNEQIIGEWVATRGVAAEIRIVTKGGHPDVSGWRPGQPANWRPRINAEEITADAALSLETLGLDHVDGYLLHRDDPSVLVTEIASLLADLVSTGTIRRVGVSNWTAQRVRALIDVLETTGGPRLDFVSNYFGLAVVSENPDIGGEAVTPELIDLAEQHQFELLVYRPRAQGYFSAQKRGEGGAFDSEESRRRRRILDDVAARYGKDPGAVLSRWLVRVHPAIVPVVGSTRPEGVRELAREVNDSSLDAAVVELTAMVGPDWRDPGKLLREIA